MFRKQFARFLSGLFLLLVLVFTSCATSQDSLSAIRSRGVLLVGATGDYRPMSYLEPETGKYVGFDAAFAEDLASSLGVRLEFVPTAWPTLMDDTLAGKFDLAVCGITITSARKELALMSNGYLGNGKTVLCRSEDAGKYVSLAAVDRPDVRVMENPGGLNEKFARANLPHAVLIIHPVNEEIPGLIASGKADVMITEIMEAAYYSGKDSRLAAPLLERPFTRGELGVLLPPGNETLLQYVNSFIEQERSSGRLDELVKQYLHLEASGEGPSQEIPSAAYGLGTQSIKIPEKGLLPADQVSQQPRFLIRLFSFRRLYPRSAG